MPFFQGASLAEKKTKWPVSEAHGLYLPMVLCQSKILGGVFKYGIPDGLPDMTFHTSPSRMAYRQVPGPSETWFCD